MNILISFIFLFCASSVFAETETKISNYKNIFVSGQPSAEALASFKKKQNGAVVIDLRALSELGHCQEPAEAAKLKLEYQKIFFEGDEAIDPNVIARIDNEVSAAGDKPVLLFCKSGSRSSAWLTLHLVRHERMGIEQALAMTRPMGLKPGMELKVREFLKNN